MKTIVSGMMLSLMLISTLTLALNIQPVKASGTIYIRADGSIDPPTAPISTVDNVTYTLTDDITSSGDGIIVERDKIIIDGDGYTVQGPGTYPSKGIYLYQRSNIKIKNIEIKTFSSGIEVWYSSNCSISGSDITGNDWGICLLWYSSNNNIVGNNINYNTAGIQIGYPSSLNSISGNNITDNDFEGIFNAGSFNIISGNNIIANHQFGIESLGPFNDYIYGNRITNTNTGIYLNYVYDTTFYGNNITDNEYGIMLDSSSNNRFYHNNFISNTQQVYIWQSYLNVWDDGYPSGGNYWSDYSGTDVYRGIYQNETGSDGIGDKPYIVDENNVDHYPFMNPWTPTPPAIATTIDIDPDALNLRSKGNWMTAYIELPEGFDVNNINVSSILLNNTIPVAPSAPVTVADYDSDGIPDLMVKFDRAKVVSYILSNVDVIKLIKQRFMTITLTIAGKLNDGTPFQGSTTITILLWIPPGLLKGLNFL
jgi:parallel beta-helix repeat protein